MPYGDTVRLLFSGRFNSTKKVGVVVVADDDGTCFMGIEMSNTMRFASKLSKLVVV